MRIADDAANVRARDCLDADAVRAVLRTIDDPEMPISIVDLGIVQDVRVSPGDAGNMRVAIDILPTFVGCPALDLIRSEIERKLRAAGAAKVEVNFVYDPPWTVDRITPAGREALRQHGVSVPTGRDGARSTSPPPFVQLGVPNSIEAVYCPMCGGRETALDSPFGPSRCRTIYYCQTCRSQFEHVRRV